MKNTIKAIIVEDEELPRKSLLQKLQIYHPEIEVFDSCETCELALESILRNRPDLIFLDIQLPDHNSIWLIERLQAIASFPMPAIIFTTAFNDSEYMLKAIKFAAVDYLLKPVNIEDLAISIKKVKERMATERNSIDKTQNRTYTFRTFNSMLVVNEKEFVYALADGNYCKIFLVSGMEEMIFERLGDVEIKMDNSLSIIRAGRSHLINKEYIYKLDTKKNICQLYTPITNKYFNIEIASKVIKELSEILRNE